MSNVFRRTFGGNPEDVPRDEDIFGVSIWVRVVCRRVLISRYEQSLPHVPIEPDHGYAVRQEPWRTMVMSYSMSLTRALQTESHPPWRTHSESEWIAEQKRLTTKGLIELVPYTPWPAPWPVGWPTKVPAKPANRRRL